MRTCETPCSDLLDFGSSKTKDKLKTDVVLNCYQVSWKNLIVRKLLFSLSRLGQGTGILNKQKLITVSLRQIETSLKFNP